MLHRLRISLQLQLVVVKITLREPALSLDEIAHLAGVPALSPRTVGRWRALYRQRGSSAFAEVHKHAGGRPRKLSPQQERLVRRLILQNPTAQLTQLRRALRRRLRITLDVANLSRLLRRLGLSKKVAVRRHRRQDPCDQARYILDVAGIAPANLYFMDECSFAPDVALRTHAWSAVGERSITTINILSDARFTVCGCIGLRESLVQAMVTRKSFTKEGFNAFVCNDLIPYLPPFSTLVLDNVAIHGLEPQTMVALERRGVSFLMLSPYSPQMNPIEECWNVAKAYVRTVQSATGNRPLSEDIADALVATISPSLVFSCFQDCGYSSYDAISM